MWASISALVRRPSTPVPAIIAGLILFSATRRRTAGDSGISLFGAVAGWAAGAGAAVDAAGTLACSCFAGVSFAAVSFAAVSRASAFAAGAAPSFSMARPAPTSTTAPSAAMISPSVPAAGAGTSRVTLSVSSSTTGSSAFTASPVDLIQRATVASATDSPSVGTLISIAIFQMPPQAIPDAIAPLCCDTVSPAILCVCCVYVLSFGKFSAAATSAFCSRLWRANVPVAGEAAASRPA